MDKGEHKKYRLGVALSGGGARGFAHAGALKAIEEAGLYPDVIAGVSAGSIAAVLYAGGLTPMNIATLFAKTGFRDFAELSIGQCGIFKLDKFARFIVRALGGPKRLEDLRIPIYIG
ncbi:MAG: patatin-like phospholipase family protein, partial [Muribaculaceae bacterium]|nr:patatin-like phospholipase family protein [Muribaculaceae bacterium]